MIQSTITHLTSGLTKLCIPTCISSGCKIGQASRCHSNSLFAALIIGVTYEGLNRARDVYIRLDPSTSSIVESLYCLIILHALSSLNIYFGKTYSSLFVF